MPPHGKKLMKTSRLTEEEDWEEEEAEEGEKGEGCLAKSSLFKRSTLFTLNPSFARTVCGMQSSSVVRFHDVKLITKESSAGSKLLRLQPNASRGPEDLHCLDLAHVFERRRAIIDSSIVRMLKREKEMSVDCVVLLVS